MNFIGLSGLPRSGSTLLSSILSQNTNIHSEGNSPVCQLMWDMQVSCYVNSKEQFMANGKTDIQKSLVASIPKIYYKNTYSKHIIDKCRSWTIPANMNMIRDYITDNPKVIVMTRPVDDIVQSFVRLRKINGWTGNLEEGLLDEGSDPIMRSLAGVKMAKESGSDEFLFIEYDDLIDNTYDVLKKVYSFCEIEYFNHDLNNIKNIHPENDKVYGLNGMHDIRSNISRRKV